MAQGNEVQKDEFVDLTWPTIGKAYVEAMDEVMPFLTVAEQIVYQRLFRLFSRARHAVYPLSFIVELSEMWQTFS